MICRLFSIRTAPWLAPALALFGALSACTSAADNSGFSNDGSSGGGGGDGGVLGGGDGGVLGGKGDGAAGGSRQGCSADLQHVVDGQGNVVQTCPPDQGCASGQCVPACQAAAASQGSVGCDFVVSTPSFQQQIAPPCFAVFLANNWPRNVSITVTRGGQTVDITSAARIPAPGQPESSWASVGAGGLPPNQVAVLFLSSDPNAQNGGQSMTCPVPPAIGSSTAVAGTGKGQAFHVVTDTPVSAYDIHPYGGAKSFLPSAELLLPTSAWGTNYIAAMPRNGDYQNGGVADGPQWAQILAAKDDTTVKIAPTTALPGGNGVSAAPAGQVTTLTLNAGEYAQWQPQWDPSNGVPMEMSGSVISSDKPVMFEGGNGYLCLASSTNASMNGAGGGCDSGHQTIPPVSALGSEYAVAPYATRRADMQEESILYRIVGAVAGTTLTYDPPTSGPTSLGVGQMVDFQATGAFVVKSQDGQHPFYIGQMMSGAFVQSGSRPGATDTLFGVIALGDEEYVNVLPPAQYLQKYVFFTDPTYPTTNLVVVRKKRQDGTMADVSVDCLGKIGGWKPIGAGGAYEATNVDLLRGGTSSGSCQNGGHVAQSDGAFGMTVWGEDSFSSYAYPAGGNVATINSVVVPPTTK